MKKSTALELLGGDIATAARNIGCTRTAIYAWPDPLPRRIADRVLAARVRMNAEITRAQGFELPPIEADAVAL